VGNNNKKIIEKIENTKLNNLIKVYEYIEERNDDGELLKEHMLEAGWVNTNLIYTINYYDWIEIDNIRYVKVSFEQKLRFNFENWWVKPNYYLKKSDLE